MSDKQQIIDTIDSRFRTLLIGLQMAQQEAGVAVEGSAANAEPEHNRELLRVEKQAKRDKDLNKRSRQNYLDGLLAQVHDEVVNRMMAQFDDMDELYAKVLGVHENLPDVLDILSVRAASISRIEPVAATISWLQSDLLKMVNMPKYRRTDKFGNAITVDSLKIALAYIGVENLKMVIPSLALRRWIPQITDPYPFIKGRLWDHAIGSSIACQTLASMGRTDQCHAFTLGMFHEVGMLVIVRLYFRLFDRVHREMMEEAHHKREREVHAGLQELEPSGLFLRDLLKQHSISLSAKIIRHMDLRRVFIANGMEEQADGVAITDMSPMGRILAQGSAYNKYRMLKANKLISMDEAKEYLSCFRYPKGALALLKNKDLRRLNLNFDEE